MAQPSDHAGQTRRQTDGAPRRFMQLLACCACAFSSPAAAATASNHQVEISGLSDVAFGTITNFAADAVSSESICVYAKSKPSDQYSITANGSGTGGAFTLSSGSATLAYDVQWNGVANQSSGTSLTPNQPLMGQQNTAANSDCSQGAATTASVIVTLRSAALNAASSGFYSGTLTLLVAPE